MSIEKLGLDIKSLETELKQYKDKPLDCLCEYIWNSFDAHATEVHVNFKMPKDGLGYVYDLEVVDNGDGWDFDNEKITNRFISSTKETEIDKTLPRGKYGRGRYTFIWFCDELHVLSLNKEMILRHGVDIVKNEIAYPFKGACVKFRNIGQSLSEILIDKQLLERRLALEFGWFIAQSESYKIWINGDSLDISSFVKEEKIYDKYTLPSEIGKNVGEDFFARIIIWKDKPLEFSKFYFLDENSKETCKQNTGLNKKGDEFWHSVYVKDLIFNEMSLKEDLSVEKNDDSNFSLFDNKEQRFLRKGIMSFLKKELASIRKPYLTARSDVVYEKLQNEQVIPNLEDFGIYDSESYRELIKTVYVISPTLFTSRGSAEKKFICASFAGLLTNDDENLVKIVLEQLQELSDEEKKDLLDILKRTRLSNVVKTVKEIDHRIEVVENLQELLFNHEKDALEVNHLQKILDDNFWIFGEQFRLFSTTEGRLSQVLQKYAREILKKDESEILSNSRKELDLFLTKNEIYGDFLQKNVIVELKRPSIKLGKKEYDQIELYMETIAEESLCNGENQKWEFYLVGTDFDNHIKNKIISAANYGEKERGLCHNNEGKFKIYVRKWSDILFVEWASKLNVLKNNLQIKVKNIAQTPNDIVESIVGK